MSDLVDIPVTFEHAIELAQDHGTKFRELALPPAFFVVTVATILGSWRKAGCDAEWLRAAEAAARAAYERGVVRPSAQESSQSAVTGR